MCAWRRYGNCANSAGHRRGAKQNGKIFYIHVALLVVAVLRAAGAFLTGHVDLKDVKVLYIFDTLTLVIMYWVYTFVVAQWLSIFHYASAAGPTGNTFAMVRQIYLMSNTFITLVMMGLIGIFTYMVLENLPFSDILEYVTIAQSILSGFTVLLGFAFVFYGWSLTTKIALTAQQNNSKPPAVLSRLYLASVVLSLGQIAKSVVGFLAVWTMKTTADGTPDPDSMLVKYHDEIVYFHYGVEFLMLSTIVHVYVSYVNSVACGDGRVSGSFRTSTNAATKIAKGLSNTVRSARNIGKSIMFGWFSSNKLLDLGAEGNTYLPGRALSVTDDLKREYGSEVSSDGFCHFDWAGDAAATERYFSTMALDDVVTLDNYPSSGLPPESPFSEGERRSESSRGGVELEKMSTFVTEKTDKTMQFGGSQFGGTQKVL